MPRSRATSVWARSSALTGCWPGRAAVPRPHAARAGARHRWRRRRRARHGASATRPRAGSAALGWRAGQPQAQQRQRVEGVLRRRVDRDAQLVRTPRRPGGRSRRAWVRSRPAPSGPTARAGRRTAPAGSRRVGAALRAPAAAARRPGRRRARSDRTRSAGASRRPCACRRGERLAPLRQLLPHGALVAIVQRRPGGDLVERALAAFAPAAGRIHAAHADAGGGHAAGGRSCLHHVGHGAPVSARVPRAQPEHAVGVPGRGPDLVEAEQLAIDQRHRRRGMRQRRHAADGEAGARLDEVGIGAAERAGQRGDLLLVDALVARGRRPAPPRRRPCGGRSRSWRSGRPATPSASAASCEVRAATSSHSGAWAWPRAASACATRRKASGRGKACEDVAERGGFMQSVVAQSLAQADSDRSICWASSSARPPPTRRHIARPGNATPPVSACPSRL